jgi:hypothetical protein
MLYRDYMQKFRPLMAPDGAVGATSDGAAAASAGTGDSAAASLSPSPTSSEATAATPGADAAAAAPSPEIKAEPTLLEAAAGKKPDAKPEGDGKKEAPAPAEAAKTEADKAAGEAGDKKPEKTEAEKKAEADAAKATDPEKKDATPEAAPAPIKYEAFKIPEGVKLDDKKLAEFSELVGAAQLPQEKAQQLVDMYVAEVPRFVQELRAEQRKHWDTLNDTWKTELRNDPNLGGNRLETTLSLAKAVVEEYLPADKVGEYMSHMRNNGMGNYLLHVQLLHNIGKALNVFEDGIVPASPQSPKPQKGPGNRGWYDKSLNQPAS